MWSTKNSKIRGDLPNSSFLREGYFSWEEVGGGDFGSKRSVEINTTQNMENHDHQ